MLERKLTVMIDAHSILIDSNTNNVNHNCLVPPYIRLEIVAASFYTAFNEAFIPSSPSNFK